MTSAVFRSPTKAFIALAVAAIASFGFAAQAHAARGMELSLQDDAVFVSKGYYKNTTKAYQQARAVGTSRIKVNVLWAYTMPSSKFNARNKPAGVTYNFAAYDQAIDQAAAQGIRVHVALTGPAPRWATGNKSRVSGFKPNATEYGKFAAAAAAHFKGRVDRYSVWNEPNWGTWLGPIKSQASLYRGLYTQGYAAIKAADPRAKVLIGETSPSKSGNRSQSPLTFLRSLACVDKSFKRVRKCAPLRADGYAHHPYDLGHAPNNVPRNPDDVTMGNLSSLTRTLDRLRSSAFRVNGGGRMPVYLTEYGYMATGNRAVKPSLRVKWLKQAYSIALANPRVKSQLQYLLVAPPKNSPSYFFNTALLTTKGKAYPNYNALKSWYGSHRGSVKRPGGAINLPPAPGSPGPVVVPPPNTTPVP